MQRFFRAFVAARAKFEEGLALKGHHRKVRTPREKHVSDHILHVRYKVAFSTHEYHCCTFCAMVLT